VETSVEFEGATLFIEDLGDGPDVVTLLHPGLWDHRTWDPQIEPLLDAGYRVIRHDFRGYGRSSWPVEGQPFSNVRDLAAVLDARGVTRKALVGCSMGGALAIDFTLTDPGRVWALVPVATGLGGFETTPDEEAAFGDIQARFVAALDAEDHVAAQTILLEEIWAPLGHDDDAGRAIWDIAMENLHRLRIEDDEIEVIDELDPPAAGRLGEIHVPTLVITAAADPPDMRRIGAVIAAEIEGAREVVLDGADHVANLRQPEAFDALLLPFLEEHRP
jgi:pimeloyl-ACP methyl ester carboxylesterase